MKTYAAAMMAGQALLRKMKGNGWQVSVHENLGWHFHVYHQFADYRIKVYQDDKHGKLIKNYWCLFGDVGGLGYWTPDTKSFDDPNKAVARQFKIALEYTNRDLLNVLELGRLIGEI